VLPWRRLSFLITFVLSSMCLHEVNANFLFGSIKRVAIFPARGVDDTLVDELWWQLREAIAADGRFDVATRRLMINRQVLAPRSELKPADAVILGRVLDADLLITHYVIKKKAVVSAVRAVDGLLVWRDEVPLNPAIPDSDQLLPIFKSVMTAFLNAVPYAGYQVLSPDTQKLYESDGSLGFVYVSTPNAESLLGQKIYWLNVTYSSQPLLKAKGAFQPLSWGKSVEFIRPNILKVKLERPFDELVMSSGVPVYVSLSAADEASVPLFGSKISEMGSEYLISDLKINKRITEQSGSATFLGFVISAAMLLLIAL